MKKYLMVLPMLLGLIGCQSNEATNNESDVKMLQLQNRHKLKMLMEMVRH